MTDKEVEERIASAVALGIEKQRKKERAERKARNARSTRISAWIAVAIILIFFAPFIVAIWKSALREPAPSKQEAYNLCVTSLAGFGIITELTIESASYSTHGFIAEPENTNLGRLHLQGMQATEDGDEETVNCILSKNRVYYLNYHPAGSPDGSTQLIKEDIKETLYTQ